MSLLDETSSDLPVKDTDCRPAVIKAIQDVISGSHTLQILTPKDPKMREKDVRARRRVCLISREELEDRFLRLHEENLLLKDYARKQEDKLKRMATKLLRLTSDLRKHDKKTLMGTRRDGRDLEAEESTEDLQDRVRDLERRNEALRHRLTTYKQRLQLQEGCRHCPYSAVSARTDSCIRKNTVLSDKHKKGLRVQGPETDHSPRVTADYYTEISDDARAEIERLFQVIGKQNFNVDDTRSAVMLKNMVTVKPKDPGTEIMLSLHHMQQIEDERTTIQENVLTIRLQKELREKNTSLCALREQFKQLKESYETELEEKQKSLTLSHNALLTQLDDLTSQLKAERDKVMAMDIDQQNMVNLQRSLLEFQEQVGDLEKENELLKENYEKLLKSSLDSEHVNSWKTEKAEMKEQILRLEEQIQSHIFDHKQSKEQLQHEREQNGHLKQEVCQLQYSLLEKMQEIHNLQNKISAILSATTAKEVLLQKEVQVQNAKAPNTEGMRRLKDLTCEKEEVLWRDDAACRKEKGGDKYNQTHPEVQTNLDCVDRRDKEEKRCMELKRERRMKEMEAAHVETILELEKTREMLTLQHKINKDYQEELKTVKLREESESREREERERHYEARLLQRNSKIQTLEAQLKDIAYGTFPVRPRSDESLSPEVRVSPPPSLRRGETLFEVHIEGICLSPHGIRVAKDSQPTTFCIYSLYDFEIHATPLVTGIRPQYNFTSQYAVTPDPEFLRFLRVGTLTVELYQVIGGEHFELARGRLRLDTALQSRDRVHNSVLLYDANGDNMGELDYWLRLHGPLAHAQCMQRQRNKAYGYLSTHSHGGITKNWISPLNNGSQNVLTIRIWGCRSLQVRRLGYQPSPYIVYRFYHLQDHSTCIIPCSNNPQFGDDAAYPLNLTIDLERYLQRDHLYVYVFDDEEAEPGSYLGKAEVPLVSLAQGNSIQGDFALLNPSGNCAGSVQITLEWKFPYHCPGQSLWESVTGGHLSPEKVTASQQQTNGNVLSNDTPKVTRNRSRTTKPRKADEDPHGDVCSSKKGRREPHSIDYETLDEQERRRNPLPAEHQHDNLDMDVEEISMGQDSDQDVSLIHSDKLETQISSKEDDKPNHCGESPRTDSDDEDDIIMAEPLVPYTLPSSRIRVEVASLTLDPCSEVVSDKSVERVFVEFNFPGVPPEETETPLSLHKPIHGEEIYYHFSKVIHLDAKEHVDRRNFLYMLLEGSDSASERVRLKFTVVSDPMNEEEEECRDIGCAYLDLCKLLRRAVEPAEETLHVLDMSNPRQIIGSLHIIIEAKEAARAVYREKRLKAGGL